MLEGGTGKILVKKGLDNGFLCLFLAEKGIKLPFSTNLKSDVIGRDKPPKSDIPGGGWGGMDREQFDPHIND